MSTNHPRIEKLAAYHEKTLDDDKRAEVKAHFSTCAECRDHLAELQANSAFLAEIRRDLTAPSTPLPAAVDAAALRKLTSKIPATNETSSGNVFTPNQKSCHPQAPVVPDYALLEPIGEGSFGKVWRAEDLMGMPCAIKILPKHGEDKAGEYELNGIRQAMKLRHPNLIEIKHVGQLEGHWFYVMELVHETLEHRLKNQPHFLPESARAIVLVILEVLQHCHKQGIAHRDIKPANIGFTSSGTLKLLDLGLVTSAGRTKRTLIGTPDYMPYKPSKNPAQDDLYAVGIILHLLLHGSLPVDGVLVSASPSKNPIKSLMDRALARACSLEPTHRFPSAAEFHRFLQNPAVGQPEKNNSQSRERFPVTQRKNPRKIQTSINYMNTNQIQKINNIVKLLETNRLAVSNRMRKELRNLENPVFKIAFLGKYQVGKTRLANNAFLKQEFLLKEGNKLPTTAVPTQIVFGESPRLLVYPWLKKVEEVTLGEESQTMEVKVGMGEPVITENPSQADIARVTTATNDNDRLAMANQTASVKLEWPQESLKKFELFDLPGIDDPNTELLEVTTYQLIPKMDTAILVVEAKMLSTVELDFLRSRVFENGLSRIMVMVSFHADTLRLSATQRAEIMSTIRAQLKSIGRQHIPVAMYCYDAGVDGDILNTPEAIESHILSYLEQNVSASRLEKATHILHRDVSNAVLTVATKLATADKTEGELVELKKKIEAKEKELSTQYETMRLGLKLELAGLQNKAYAEFEGACDKASKQYLDGFDGCGVVAVRERLGQSNKLLKPALEAASFQVATGLSAGFAKVVTRYEKDLVKAAEAFYDSMPIQLQINPGWFGRLDPALVVITDYALVFLRGPYTLVATIAVRYLAGKIPFLKNLLLSNVVAAAAIRAIKKSVGHNMDEIKANMKANLQGVFSNINDKIKDEFSKLYLNQVGPILKALDAGINSPALLSAEDRAKLKLVQTELENFGLRKNS